MRLALYSNQTLSETERITALLFSRIGKANPKIGYISSAPDPDRVFYHSVAAYYRQFGGTIGPYNDLEDGYDARALEGAFDSDALHLTGGNTYRFLNWIQKRSIKDQLMEYANAKGTLIGVSAGAILMSPTVESSTLCGDTDEIGLSDLAGLQLFPFLVIPHAQAIDGLAAKAQRLVKQKQIPAFALRDNQALFYDGTRVENMGGAEFYPFETEGNRANACDS